MKKYGSTTGIPPTQPKNRLLTTNMTITNFINGLKKKLLIKLTKPNIYGKNNKNTKANTKAIIPNNLSGTDLNIAYKGKKYHSGTICVGVTNGLLII